MENKDLPERLKSDDIAKDFDISISIAGRVFKIELFPYVKKLSLRTTRIVK